MAVKKEPTSPAGKKQAKKADQKKPKPQEKQLQIRLVRSLVARPRYQREVVKGLGLRRVNSKVIRPDRPEIRGMINKIPHLVDVETVEEK